MKFEPDAEVGEKGAFCKGLIQPTEKWKDTVMNSDILQNGNSPAIAGTTTPDLEIPFGACLIDGNPEPCMIVIVGASGDLTSRKIIPALFNLYLNNGLSDPFLVVGCARTRLSDQEFRDKMEDALKTANILDNQRWQGFAKSLHYLTIDYEELPSFEALAGSLRKLDIEHGMKGNRVFYLAIPPSLYKSTAQMLGNAGLSTQDENNNGWVRIVVEKPFGRDLDTAIDLDRSLHEHFKEHQIFRIDHYLAKETVQISSCSVLPTPFSSLSGTEDTLTM